MFSLRHPVLALALVALVSAGCAGSGSDPRTGGAVPPVARVVGDVAPGESTMRVAIDIAGLDAPGDVVPDATAFVVWYRGHEDRGWVRLGSLDHDPETRNAKLPGVVVDGTSFELIVTAETESSPRAPSPWVLFAQAVKA